MHIRKFAAALFVILSLALVPAVLGQESHPLLNTQWMLISLGGNAPVEGTGISLIFDDGGNAGGNGSCNSYGGSVVFEDENTIGFGQLVSTMMACEEAIMAQETAYFNALQSAATYELRDGQLVIIYGEGEELVFAPAPSLQGTRWELVLLAEAAPVGDTPLTLEFGEENAVNGNGGCNTFRSVAEITGDRLTLSGIVSTRRACLSEEASAQETAYFRLLESASTYAIEGNELTIMTNEGDTLVFSRVIALEGTAWQLGNISGNPTVVGGVITIQFGEDGQVTGSGGCNQFGGSYAFDGETLTLDGVATTERACLDTAVMEQESAFYAALSTPLTVELEGDQLTLTSEDGQTWVFTPLAATSAMT